MKGNLNLVFLLFMATLSFTGCVEEVHNLHDLDVWINKPSSGLIVQKAVNGILLTLKYLPPQYSALKEMEANGWKSKKQYDSLLTTHQYEAAFVMTLGPDEATGNKDDIMYKGLKNFKEYVERSETLNFDMESRVKLITETGSYAAALSSMENTYGLSKDRKLNFVFVPTSMKDELEKAKQYDFVYTDEIYGCGILHFSFDKTKIRNNMPEVIIH